MNDLTTYIKISISLLHSVKVRYKYYYYLLFFIFLHGSPINQEYHLNALKWRLLLIGSFLRATAKKLSMNWKDEIKWSNFLSLRVSKKHPTKCLLNPWSRVESIAYVWQNLPNVLSRYCVVRYLITSWRSGLSLRAVIT